MGHLNTETDFGGGQPLSRQFLRNMYFALLTVQLGAAATVVALTATARGVESLVFWGVVGTQVVVALAQLLFRALMRLSWRRELALFRSTDNAREKIGELFAMTDMLQAAETYEDAGAVLMATTKRLLPEYGAALYIFNNSRDRLDLARCWDLPEGYHAPEVLSPSNCWTLKRGKPHINDPAEGTLLCAHHSARIPSVEIPMMAAGQVHGLLVLALDHEDAAQAFGELKDIRRLSRALADSMSLALSNIGLREKLRTQSLRDPLTGLYNRRYMEDALERFLSLDARNGGTTAVIMLDLDNFKALNDQHGHAKGDAVLRDVASQLVGGLRPSDVVCRFGGEELLAILPDCNLEEAAKKAEELRLRIEALSAAHECQVSASFGVASVPEAATSASDIIPLADAALYGAKQAGKNRVHVAERRAQRETTAPRLAVSRKA